MTPAIVGAAAIIVSLGACTGRPQINQERSASAAAFTDTAWYRAHCVATDTLRPDLTACVLRDQSVTPRRAPGTAPLLPVPRRP